MISCDGSRTYTKWKKHFMAELCSLSWIPVISRVRMENWPVWQQLYAFIKTKLVVEMQRRIRHEFCLEGMQEYHPLTVFWIGQSNSRVLCSVSRACAIDLHAIGYLQGETSHDLKSHLIWQMSLCCFEPFMRNFVLYCAHWPQVSSIKNSNCILTVSNV